jgi:hypothetical protein
LPEQRGKMFRQPERSWCVAFHQFEARGVRMSGTKRYGAPIAGC